MDREGGGGGCCCRSRTDCKRLQNDPVSRNFLTTDHGEQNQMSYAGPVSRATRASEMQLVASQSTATGRSGGHAARPRAQTSTAQEGRATVFTAGLLVGLAIGAGIALLVAPQSGAETREALARRGRRLRRRGSNAWEDLRDELRRVGQRRKSAGRRQRTEKREPEI